MVIRIVLVLLVLSSSVGLAEAEWEKVYGPDSESTVYIDPSTRRVDKKSGLVKMWVLIDFKTAQKVQEESFLSLRTQQQYDCKEEKNKEAF